MKFFAIVAVLLGAVAVSGVQAADFPINWRVETYEPITVAPGDTVTFTWLGTHGVVKIPTEECPTSFASNPEVTVLAPETAEGTYVWTATEPGVTWVTCQVGSHCANGQKIGITVA
ncbi:hypothetical protein Ndes2526B_g00085 [Nannochloris sp. 'desiccata']|nr:hypothetical protein KSW81_002900 [Chlorella desiccata (nom. nud.)]KAH7624720.1 hypothetical protein NADE_001943 [Chlorella desiccata (nom. nud.)]